jgi:FkbM family methyltransferase
LKQLLKKVLAGPAAHAAYFKALFENEIELRLLPYLCDPQRLAVDVGAFSGTYTIGMHFHAGRVIAVEPQPRQAAALRRAMPAGVQIVEAALSDSAKDAWLEMNTVEGGSMSQVSLTGRVEDGRVAWRIKLVRLDDIANEAVGFVKIDAEGHEVEVLSGALETIRRSRPALVIEAEERLQHQAVDKVRRILEPFDYTGCFVARGRVRPIAEFDPAIHQDIRLLVEGTRREYQDYINNFIFLPRERSGSLPAIVPGPWEATRSSLGAWATRP